MVWVVCHPHYYCSGIRSSAPASHPLLCTGGSGGKRFTLKAQALHLIPDPLHQLIIGTNVKLMDLGSVLVDPCTYFG